MCGTYFSCSRIGGGVGMLYYKIQKCINLKQAKIRQNHYFYSVNLLKYFFLICCAYHFLYQLVLLISIKSRKNNIKNTLKPTKEAVSILICAKDEQINLEKNLPYIFQQIYPDFEVIIVDDGSTEPFTMQHPLLKIIRVNKEEKIGLGKKYALQKGVEAANKTWILLTDADCQPTSEHWIEEMMKNADKQHKIVLGISPYNTKKGLLNSVIEYETAQTALQYLGFAILGSPYMSVGRNVLYHAELLKTKKWNSQELAIASGDDDLAIQSLATAENTTVCLAEDSYTTSDAKSTWQEWIIQKKRHYQSGGLYRVRDRILLGSFLSSKLILYFAFCVMLVLGNIYLAAILFLIYVGINTLFQFMLYRFTQINTRWHISFITDFIYCIFTVTLGIFSTVKQNHRWK
jgi:glycosyltransferase involved in cell wall biosynthesis